MSPGPSGLVQSVQTRLLQHARGIDADLLGYGDLSTAEMQRVFREVCTVAVEPDGVSYSAASVKVAPIRVEDAYGGRRVRLRGLLGKAKLTVQVDVGIGDAVTPEPKWLDYPSLLDLPRPRLRAYQPETSIAEKLHAMTVLGMTNSRMRDFFDVHELARQREFGGAVLAAAIRDTFHRRQTPAPTELPSALTPAFGQDPAKQAQWRAFLRKSRLALPEDFGTAVRAVAHFLAPVVEAVGAHRTFAARWPAGGPWRPETRRVD